MDFLIGIVVGMLAAAVLGYIKGIVTPEEVKSTFEKKDGL
jgi:hypothetical protein